ncbi:MAG: pilus assembly protein PilM [Smithella sp.]
MADNIRYINFTEKPLNAIRGKQYEKSDNIGKISILSHKEVATSFWTNKLSRLFSNKKNHTVGIDISHDYIYLVKVISDSDAAPVLINQKIIKYEAKIPKGSPEFNSLLKSSLFSICGNPANCNIWTMMSGDNVNIHYLKIPPVQKKQMENAIYWAAKKETSFDEKDYIFDFEIQEEIIEQGIPKNSVMVYSAPIAEIEKTRALFSNIGISLAGITIPPFAIQNIYRMKWLPADETTATLFIGNEFSRINIYRKDKLVMSRGIKTGISSMLEIITDSFLSKKGILTLEKENAEKILFSLGSDAKKTDKADDVFGLEKDEIFSMIIPVIERLTRQIERTLQHYTTSTGRERVENLFISSAMNLYDPVLKYLSDQLGVKVELFDPLQSQTKNRLAENISSADRMALVPALGLALSGSQHTPNLIFTYKEKNNETNIKKINRGIIAAFAASLIICVMSIFHQSVNIFVLKKQRASLNKELSMYKPLISADNVKIMANDIKRRQSISHQYAERYLGIAAIGEISSLTPENIRLNSLKIMTPAGFKVKDNADKTQKEETTAGITLEGVVSGERNMLNSYLAQYVMSLSNSPMLQQVSILKNDIVNFKKKEVLQFSMSVKPGK